MAPARMAGSLTSKNSLRRIFPPKKRRKLNALRLKFKFPHRRNTCPSLGLSNEMPKKGILFFPRSTPDFRSRFICFSRALQFGGALPGRRRSSSKVRSKGDYYGDAEFRARKNLQGAEAARKQKQKKKNKPTQHINFTHGQTKHGFANAAVFFHPSLNPSLFCNPTWVRQKSARVLGFETRPLLKPKAKHEKGRLRVSRTLSASSRITLC